MPCVKPLLRRPPRDCLAAVPAAAAGVKLLLGGVICFGVVALFLKR